jgi:hypothetical protein
MVWLKRDTLHISETKYVENKSYKIYCRFTTAFYKEPTIFNKPTSPALLDISATTTNVCINRIEGGNGKEYLSSYRICDVC